jgi:hypothetical protein
MSFWMMLICLLACFSNATAQDRPPSVSAPIDYKDLMLILTTKETIVAIVFDDEIDTRSKDGTETEKGVKYRFRSLSLNEKKESLGEAVVVEKFKHMKTDNPRIIEYVDLGSVLQIKVGTAKRKWGYQGPGRGWLYYYPEDVTVQIAHRRNFKSISLDRFRK